jgi:hypothetical protein
MTYRRIQNLSMIGALKIRYVFASVRERDPVAKQRFIARSDAYSFCEQFPESGQQLAFSMACQFPCLITRK